MLLAIDTSTALTSLACYDQSGLLAECAWHSARNHTAQVLPQLDMLLRHLQRNADHIQVIAVALGPGSWSGLRVGLSIAKGMALAGDLALLGVGTLDMLAYQHQHPVLPVCALIRLGRERFAAAKFQYTDSSWMRMSENENISLADLSTRIHEPTLICGDIDATVQEQLRRSVGTHATFPLPAARMRRAGYLAELAWRRFVAGEHDDLARLEPLYLGEPVRPVARTTG
jgi:tRNA threonylcarbamoyladenosine biosynthesis protein TsaB